MAGATWLPKIDLKKCFYQVPVQKECQHKTSFCMPWGKYAFTRMPFGLKNAPATFQRCMDKVLEGQAGFSSTYIDDVLIFSNTWEEHVEHTRGVLGALGQAGMTANSAKCEWDATALTYLGYKVGIGKIKVPEARVKAIETTKSLTSRRVYVHFLVPLAITGGLSQTMPGGLGHCMTPQEKWLPIPWCGMRLWLMHFNT